MRNLENYIYNARTEFSDPSILGVFVENHDNPRFLNRCNDRYKFKNANILSIFWEGIPVFYYGGEQWFSGGADPNNREPLWGHYDTDSDMYKSLSIANNVRTEQKIWKFTQVQRYADDVFYSFTRGNVLVCVCNGSDVNVKIKGHKFDEGTVLYNAFNKEDFVTVKDGEINIVLEKKLILEKDVDGIKVVEKKTENELEKENENDNDNNYEPNNFMPLDKEDNLKENEGNNTQLKNEKFNKK